MHSSVVILTDGSVYAWIIMLTCVAVEIMNAMASPRSPREKSADSRGYRVRVPRSSVCRVLRRRVSGPAERARAGGVSARMGSGRGSGGGRVVAPVEPPAAGRAEVGVIVDHSARSS